MKVIVGISLILLLALLGSRWTFTRVRLPLAARHIYLTGTEYILVGLFLGEEFLGLLDQATLNGLSPLLHLALGWIGFLFGAQLEFRQVLRFPKPFILVALSQGFITFLVCFISFLLILKWLPLSNDQDHLIGALVLATAAVPTGQASLAILAQKGSALSQHVMELLRFVAGLDAIIGLMGFGFLFSLIPDRSLLGWDHCIAIQYIFLAILLGEVMGLALHWLTRIHCSQEELLLFTIGIVVLSAGAAAMMELSSLFVNLVSGILIANLRGEKKRITRVLVTMEKPLYLVVLILGGAAIRPVGWSIFHVLACGALYIAIRMFGKLLGGLFCYHRVRSTDHLPLFFGLGLIAQGGVAAAMVMSFYQAHISLMASSLITIVLMAILVNELISPTLVGLVIRHS